MWQRPLGDLLIDVIDAIYRTRTGGDRVRLRSIELTLPVEVALQDIDGELTFIADVPAWRWRTMFDREPGQLHITLEESQS